MSGCRRIGLWCGLVLLAVGPCLAAADAAGTSPEALARQLLDDLASGHFAAAEKLFNARMADALPVEKLEDVWHRLVGQVGELQAVQGTRSDTVQGYDVVTVACTFGKGPLDARVAVDSDGRVAGLFFAPHREAPAGTPAPTPPAAAATPTPAAAAATPSPAAPTPPPPRERAVTVGSGHWQLPGTLTLPDGEGPFPAVVLVHGSGPADRDETIGPNRPFRDLAWGLARRGVATLRYEKRTFRYQVEISAHQTGFTVEQETVDDARKAVALLTVTPEVDAGRIVVLGHSLGGYLAPRIAAGDADVAGLVILAGSSRPLEDLVVEQTRYLLGLDGKIDAADKKRIAAAEAVAAKIRDPKLAPGDTVTIAGGRTPASYWLDLRSYHPVKLAASLHLPMLILGGGRDYQVTQADMDGWEAGLAGRSDVTFKVYPQLDHLFMPGGNPPTPDDYLKPGHVAPLVIDDIADWVKALRERSASPTPTR